jgi:rubrerythrin
MRRVTCEVCGIPYHTDKNYIVPERDCPSCKVDSAYITAQFTALQREGGRS